MPFGFHGLDLIAVLAIALLIFGPKKLPEMGASIGKSIKEFRKGMSELNKPEEPVAETPVATPKMINSTDDVNSELAHVNEVHSQPVNTTRVD